MSRSDNNKNSIFDFAKTLLGQKPGGVCRVDERYDEYVIENSPTEEQLAAQRREDFSGMPVIAVAIAGEDGDKLRRFTEDSVKEQTYSRWIISKSPKTDEFDFIMYMWPGDILRPDALYTFAKNTEGNDLIFCDEDRLEEGQRCDPLFKPCMDRVTEYSFDMLGRGVMASRALFEASGGMTGVTGCDRYAYNLRLADRCSSACHIQKVLYTAHDRRDIGPEGRQVLENHLKKNDDIRVFPGEWRGSFRVEAIIRRPSCRGCGAWASRHCSGTRCCVSRGRSPAHPSPPSSRESAEPVGVRRPSRGRGGCSRRVATRKRISWRPRAGR